MRAGHTFPKELTFTACSGQIDKSHTVTFHNDNLSRSRVPELETQRSTGSISQIHDDEDRRQTSRGRCHTSKLPPMTSLDLGR